MRALVTGAGGFVGSHLVSHLADRGGGVVAWPGPAGAPDIADAGAVATALASETVDELDVVFHLAAQARVDRSWQDPAETMTINAGGTINLMQAIVERYPQGSRPRVVMLSSAEVYGIVDADALPITEDLAPAPRSPYGVSKLAAEHVAMVLGQAHDIDVIVCRPFNLIGPGQQPAFATSAFARRIVDNERTGTTELTVGNLSATRDFLDIRDGVRALSMLADVGVPGQIYNLCRGEEVAVAAVLDLLIARSTAHHQVVVDQARFRPNDLPRMYGSAAKLHSATGWEPRRELVDTLGDVLADWRTREETP